MLLMPTLPPWQHLKKHGWREETVGPCVHSFGEGNKAVPFYRYGSLTFLVCSEVKELKEKRLTCLDVWRWTMISGSCFSFLPEKVNLRLNSCRMTMGYAPSPCRRKGKWKKEVLKFKSDIPLPEDHTSSFIRGLHCCVVNDQMQKELWC